MTASRVRVRNTREQDFPEIISLCRAVYVGTAPWTARQLASHLEVFPEGQLVAVDRNDAIVGVASSLIVKWDDYDLKGSWKEYTDAGMFTNHDPTEGRTLYGAEVMVHPRRQRSGIGGILYQARRDLVVRLGLLRIRAGARLRGYSQFAATMTAEQYVQGVIAGAINGPTLTFQLQQGFQVLGVVADYLEHDPESLGYAATIEWLNPQLAKPEDSAGRDARFAVWTDAHGDPSKV